ncbi:MAG: CotH kinase family protein, partial [Bacteroidota bacterium]|nr:CotH kinase family protein [Bacteroidota bacterium]
MKKCLLSLLLLVPCLTRADLKINELMVKNVSYVMDDAFNYSNWVELYNPTSSAIFTTDNYFFTDDPLNWHKWNPMKVMIPAKGYAIFYFEREDHYNHAPFKLNAEGGTLYLMNRYQAVVDSVKYPPQYRNISYGRQTDGGANWVFFERPSPVASNNNNLWATQRCSNPVFSLIPGFYTGSKIVSFISPSYGDTIYYSTDCSEPTRNSTRYIPGSFIYLNSTKVYRAKTFSAGKLSSDVISATYFVNQRQPNLRVVSISTSQANLYDPKTGIYCDGDGTNGLTGNGQSVKRNYNCDWDRPVNFELFDAAGNPCLNREVDINILGGWTRANPLKSIAISPNQKFGDKQLRYPFFEATKPGLKYKDIQLRNSGNDFGNTMMRDAFIESTIMHRMDLDYLAYEPAVVFMNGVYYGIENLRERSNKDFVWSNHGYDNDDVTLLEANGMGLDTDDDIATDSRFLELSNFVKSNDMTNPVVYKQLCDKMDVDEFINYMIAEIYIANTDWPYNNIKMWKKTDGGKWRWTFWDTDFGFEPSRINHNSLTFALGENTDGSLGYSSGLPEWSVILLKRLVLNDTFRNKLIDRFAVHISTTFETNRVNHIMDSLSLRIANEIPYHKAKWSLSDNFASTLNSMKTFSASRPAAMLTFISNRFLNGTGTAALHLSANVSGASYTLNDQPVIDPEVNIKYFLNRTMAIKASQIPGYRFSHWLQLSTTAVTLIPMGSSWNYYDGSSIPATNWNTDGYSDSSWKSGPAQLGYGDAQKTQIGYGGNASAKYPTAYFRKTVTIKDLNTKTNFKITAFVDDGAVIYVNGQDVGRINMPAGAVSFNTFSSTYNEGLTATFSIPVSYLKEGNNLIAVEVHQCSVTSTDLIFDLNLTFDESSTELKLLTDSVYAGKFTGNLNLRAVYEPYETPVEKQTVFINELVSSNQSIVDEFGEKDDYIELYNAGTEPVNIAGWYLSDLPVNKQLCQIPSTDTTKTVIPVKGRLIVWADNQSEQGPLHIGLKLDK